MTKKALFREFELLIRAGRPAIGKFVEAIIQPRDVRLDSIESRLADTIARLDAERGLNFEGVWKAGRDYRRGDAVVRSGSLWIATKDGATVPPGGDGGEWVLAVKRGTL